MHIYTFVPLQRVNLIKLPGSFLVNSVVYHLNKVRAIMHCPFDTIYIINGVSQGELHYNPGQDITKLLRPIESLNKLEKIVYDID